MLEALSVQDFVLFSHLDVELSPGLTVITGETGAGKSLVLDAIALAFGLSERAKKHLVAGRTFVSLELSEASGLTQEWAIEGRQGLILQRSFSEGERLLTRLNGRPISRPQLLELASAKVDFFGQHQALKLLESRYHRVLLDSTGDESFQELLASYRKAYFDWSLWQKRMLKREQDLSAWHRELEHLSLDLQTILQHDPREGEWEDLGQQQRVLGRSQEFAEVFEEFLQTVTSGGRSVLAKLGELSRSLASLAKTDETLTPLVKELASAQTILQELGYQIGDRQGSLNTDPRALEEVEARMRGYEDLLRRFGPGIEELFHYKQTTQKRLQRLESLLKEDDDLEERCQKALERAKELARELDERRKELALELESEIQLHLADLEMAQTSFRVDFSPLQQLGEWGQQEVEFSLQANPGLPFAPLARSASGGELSRVLLSIVTATQNLENKNTILLDEIDAGLGGVAAGSLANKLKQLAQTRQVIVVSHQPVVAATADTHWKITKDVKDQKSASDLVVLDKKGRLDELSRMLAGSHDHDSVRRLALSLLEQQAGIAL